MDGGGSFEVEVGRAGVVESRHRISAVIADRNGRVQWWGDPERPTIARSAIKSIQALPLVASGAADAFGLTSDELALACASHSGEAEHIDRVLAWLRRLDLTEGDLECGPSAPISPEQERALYADGGGPRPILNGCSGKHAGFLTLARHEGWPTVGYIEATSPVQRRVTDAVAALTGVSLDDVTPGRDGCGIPVHPIPLERLAMAMARLVDPIDLDPGLAAAAERVAAAAQHAFWVSGRGRTELKVVDAATEPVVIKSGAEGVFAVALPDRGLGVVLKVEDGAQRASRVGVRALLGQLGVIPEEVAAPTRRRNKADVDVGDVRAVIGPPSGADGPFPV